MGWIALEAGWVMGVPSRKRLEFSAATVPGAMMRRIQEAVGVTGRRPESR
ncbi:hypothetical protein GCM10022265_38250 [Marinobacter xestospongiae]